MHMIQQRTAHNADQLAAALGWSRPRFDDARRMRLVPDPDVERPRDLGPRWSSAVVRQLRAGGGGVLAGR